jgi:hypothetical protein
MSRLLRLLGNQAQTNSPKPINGLSSHWNSGDVVPKYFLHHPVDLSASASAQLLWVHVNVVHADRRDFARWMTADVILQPLDRDPAHPIKVQKMQSLMRRLRLQWTSLPRRSLNDNPDETIFRDSRQHVSDTSNNLDVHAT